MRCKLLTCALLSILILGAGMAWAQTTPWKVDLAGEWRFHTGDSPSWALPGLDDSKWDRLQAPALWDSGGYADYDGYGWYRRDFTAPASAAAHGLLMEIGGVDDDDWVYLNGKLIGQGKGCYKRRLYPVPAGIVHEGTNLIAVRIFDGSMGGGLAVGPLTLREETLADRVELTAVRIVQPTAQNPRMSLELDLTSRSAAAQTLRLQSRLTDYLQRESCAADHSLSLPAGATVTEAVPFDGGDCIDYRLAVTLSQGEDRSDSFRYLQADALAGPRKTWLLNGTWDFLPVEKLAATPPQATYQTDTVPRAAWGGWSGKEHSAWFRRKFTLPANLTGQRVVLRFDAVAHFCQVLVNGKPVGSHLGGFEPFSFDITAIARAGAENELAVGVTDYTAGLKPGVPTPEDPEKLPAGCMMIPFGTRAGSVRGIWQDVTLEVRPPVVVEGSKVETSVRNGTLSARLTLRNDDAQARTVTLSPQVLDAGKPVFALASRSVTIPAQGTETVQWQRPWADARLWWPSDPHLYDLQTEVKQGQTLTDRHHTRFGFREFWIDGTDYRLNGRIFRLRGLVCAPRPESPEAIRSYFLNGMANSNFTLVRHHMFPRPRYFYDIADEVGMCLKDESAFYCAAGSYALTDEDFWANMRTHISAMVQRSWNHPALCLWSTENEILHCGGSRTPGTDAQIYKLGQLISQLDPTRPVEYEGDGDVVGRAATVNIHYPREFGCHDHNLWPNDSWWLGTEGNDRWPQDLVWKKDKPLIMGEFCYYPYSRPPGGVSIFVGDSAYRSKETERAAHVMGVRFVCEGARWAGVAGLNPWVGDTVYGQRCFPPVAVLLREWDRQFWAGETVTRTLLVLNDTLETRPLELRVEILDAPAGAFSWSAPVTLDPGGRWESPLAVTMPQRPGRYRLVARLLQEGKELYAEERPIAVASRQSLTLPQGLRVGLYDPAGRSKAALAAAGLQPTLLTALDASSLRNLDLLVLGAEAWTSTADAGRNSLPQFVAAGGKVLVLPQTTLPNWLPSSPVLEKTRAATMSYERTPGHPLLRGLDSAGRDLCWWRGDHFVARNLLRKPQAGNFAVITEAGGKGGLQWTPLLELKSGRGWWLLCQYLVDSKLQEEPAAHQLLQNALTYAAEATPPLERRVAVLGSPGLQQYLAGLGLAAEELPAQPTADSLAAYDLVIAEGSALNPQAAAALRQFAETGKTLWLYAAEGANPDLLKAVVPTLQGCAKTDSHGRAVKLSDDGLMAGISNADLFWYREDCWYEDWEGRGTGLAEETCTVHLQMNGSGRVYTEPACLAEAPVGKGRVVLSTLRLAEAQAIVSAKARRLGATLLTNLGVPLGHRQEDLTGLRQEPVDLQRYFTATLRDEVAEDGKGGWTDQGEQDLRSMPLGARKLGGITFDVRDGCLALRSASHLKFQPDKVAGIPVGRSCAALYLLHTAAWAGAEGTAVARLRVQYEDGKEALVPVVSGVNVGDWWTPVDLVQAQVAWRGPSAGGQNVGVYATTWRNPRPAVPIKSFSVESAGTDAIYLLLAVTCGLKP
ncbi:MAG: sugar-binding domain-containing protein [Armatimonadia bacterium]